LHFWNGCGRIGATPDVAVEGNDGGSPGASLNTQGEDATRVLAGGSSEVTSQSRPASLAQRAVFGHCADCGKTLEDLLDLVCDRCQEKPENQTLEFYARANGHRAQIQSWIDKGKI
jgi:hypothetical protein